MINGRKPESTREELPFTAGLLEGDQIVLSVINLYYYNSGNRSNSDL